MDDGDVAAPAGAGAPIDDAADAELRTFLIADVRGYTSFTQRHGDEKAAKLAGKFARVARDVVESHIGKVLELRGDEALCVFVSPRQAVRAAVDLQRRFVDETRWDPELPLPVGIGLDVGEAVPVEGGYRSGALNFAARLCSIAKPGEILASQELTHLARRLDGMSYVVGAPMRFKGLAEPVRPVRVRPDGEDPVVQLIGLGALPPKAPSTRGPDWLPGPLRGRPEAGVLAVAIVVALIASVLVVATRGESAGLDHLAENVAAVVDPGSGRLVAQTQVGSSPSAVAFGSDAVWVANSQDATVSRIDPQTRQVQQTIEVGSDPRAVTVGGGAVWVANSASGTVSRIDPTSNRVTLTVPVGSGPSALAYDRGVLWVVDTTAATLFRVQVATAAVSVGARVGASPVGVAVVAGHVWVSNSGTGTLSDFDPTSGAVVQTVNVGNDPRAIAVVNGDLWVTNNLDGTVTRVRPKTGSVVATLPVGAAPVAVTGTGDSVWVAGARGLTRVDTVQNRVVAQVRTGSMPTAIATNGHLLWTTASSNPALHRGGTLTGLVYDQYTLDPALGYDEPSESVSVMIYDGLLALRRTSGAAGGTVVPDLAAGLPTVSDDGLTYTFRLRNGIIWSDGKPVTGADVKRGLERTVAAGVWPLYGGIRGAAACTPKACDLSDGISVDQATGTVTIRLTKPDPEFLYKVALPGAVAVPAATPIGRLGDRVLPTTGPYRVESATPKVLTLVRNSHFRQWSAAAQPAGYPDRIVIEVHSDNPKPLSFHTLDSVDWATTLNAPDEAGLRSRFGDRLRLSPTAGTNQLALNTSLPPFDDVRARRAVAFAIDRATVATKWLFPGVVTCQLLPPTVPGYSPYCPYTLRRDQTGQWHAPDLATAQRLVRQSGTRKSRVTVVTPPGLAPAFASIVAAMRSVGFDAHLVTLTGPSYFSAMQRWMVSGRANGAFTGWLADYPAASNFLQQQVTCASDPRTGHQGSGFALYCNPALDRRVAAAERQQQTDPAAATATWSALDRRITDLAPYVPLVNPIRVDVVSSRLRNLLRNPITGALYDQAWVR